MAKRIKRTDADRIATVLQAYRASQLLPRTERMTMKEIADDLGISTRTLRRIKNEPGHELSKRTREKIHAPLVEMTKAAERQYKRQLRDAGVPMLETKTPIVLIPTVTKSRDKRTTRLGYTTEGLSASQIASAIHQQIRTGGFTSWNVKVRVPVGVSLSGALSNQGPSAVSPDTFYMKGPFDPRASTLPMIQQIVEYQMNAGRVIAEVFLARDE